MKNTNRQCLSRVANKKWLTINANHCVDTALSSRKKADIPADLEKVMFFVWLSDSANHIMAVWDYLGCKPNAYEFECIACDYIEEFANIGRAPDLIF